MTIPCKQCITFPMCNAQIRAAINTNNKYQADTITNVCKKCGPLFQWLFESNIFPICPDKSIEFKTLYRIPKTPNEADII